MVGPATVPAADGEGRLPGGAAGEPAEPDAGEVRERGPVWHHRAHGPARADGGQRASRPCRPGCQALVRSAGLAGARIEVGGETAAVGEAVSSTTASLGQLALIMLAITFVLLALFLRALLAPLYLLAASVLALLATLGVTVWIFQDRLGYDGLVYYVPFTVGGAADLARR